MQAHSPAGRTISLPLALVLGLASILVSGSIGAAANARIEEGPPERFSSGIPVEELDRAIAARLEALRDIRTPWTWYDLIERGRIAIAEGDYAAAAMAFEASLKTAERIPEQVVSRQLLGQVGILSGQGMPIGDDAQVAARLAVLRAAGEQLDEAQLLVPYSRDVAAARVMAWSLVGDELQTMAAEHQLRVIDPSLEGTPRMAGVGALVVCYVAFKAGKIILERYKFESVLSSNQRFLLMKAIDLAVSSSLKAVPLGSGVDLGVDFMLHQVIPD